MTDKVQRVKSEVPAMSHLPVNTAAGLQDGVLCGKPIKFYSLNVGSFACALSPQ